MRAKTHAAPRWLQIAAAAIGNAFEWYDFTVFGLMTIVIARLFFPAESQYASLLLTTATFGVGFFMRPVGGVVLGVYADRHGRKAALALIIALMTAAIAMIAFAPTYAAIGIAAPLVIVLARLLQGFATGGQFASATAFLIESAPAEKRGLYGSWQMVGQGMGVLMGTLLNALVTRGLGPDALERWGWRVPFLFGLLIGPVGLYIRRYLDETTHFLEARAAGHERQGLGKTLAQHFGEVLTCIGLMAAGTIFFYVILLYLPTFASTQLNLPLGDAFIGQSIGLAVEIMMVPMFGTLSDRIGRKPTMLGVLIVILSLAYPLFSWLNAAPSFTRLATAQIVLCGLVGAFMGPISTALAEQFATHLRTTCLGTAYNLAVMLFGGFAQFFVIWLIDVTGSPIAPVFYVMFGTAAGVVAALFLRERAHEAHLASVESARERKPVPAL